MIGATHFKDQVKQQKHNKNKYCIKCNILLQIGINCSNDEINRSHYICQECLKINKHQQYINNPNYCKTSREKALQRQLQVLKFYGNECVNCQINDMSVLTIDHINNDGYLHRKNKNINIYDWITKNNFPDGYQILCFNCNCSKNIEYKDQYHLKNKKIVIEMYGGKCNLCKIDNIKLLTIDHINNDGAEQRKLLKCGKGSIFYRWLIKNNFPQNIGLQVLCYNCNCSKNSRFRK